MIILMLIVLLVMSLVANVALFYLGSRYDKMHDKLWQKHFRLVHKYKFKIRALRKLADDYADLAAQPRLLRTQDGNMVFTSLPPCLRSGEPTFSLFVDGLPVKKPK